MPGCGGWEKRWKLASVRSDLFLAARAWIYFAPGPLLSLLLRLILLSNLCTTVRSPHPHTRQKECFTEAAGWLGGPLGKPPYIVKQSKPSKFKSSQVKSLTVKPVRLTVPSLQLQHKVTGGRERFKLFCGTGDGDVGLALAQATPLPKRQCRKLLASTDVQRFVLLAMHAR